MAYRISLVVVTLLLCSTFCGFVAGQTCQPDERTDCGRDEQSECEKVGCCWQPTNGIPWCFYKFSPSGQCMPNSTRIDCGYQGINQSECQTRRNCCWQPTNDGRPWCFFHTSPSSNYVVSSIQQTALGVEVTLKFNGSASSSPYGPNISPLIVEVSNETNERLHIKIYDPNNNRWEVPTSMSPVPPTPSAPASNPLYAVHLPEVGEQFNFAILRSNTMETVFNTSQAGVPLQFADQYLQIGTGLSADSNIYGIGEHVAPLRLPNRTYTLWNFDTATPHYLNLYGSHPFYLDLHSTGNAHGVFLRNSNGMDVTLGSGGVNSITYQVIGGVLDFYFFLGPEPEAVIQQYHEVIGRPHMPPYWGLGFHQCRFGYPNVQTLEQVVANYSANQIPLDTMWTDIDYMDQKKDFTLDPTNFAKDPMNQFLDKLHSNGMHYVVIIDPGIMVQSGYTPYEDGLKAGVFIKDHNNNVFTGKVWPGITAFPDFFNPGANEYWKNQISQFYNTLLPVDGLWIDMNEISNFCNGECTSSSFPRKPRVGFDPNNPPYAIHNQGGSTALNIKTLDMDAIHYGGVLEYNAHNLFGLTEAIATNMALMSVTGKRSFVISRSTFPGSGAHTGHWTGDNHSTQDDLRNSIAGMLDFQMFGIPLVGSDICGFLGDTTPDLCSRWMELGAFYPFARNHNTKDATSQEPYRWPSVAAISRKVLGIRYSLLPYYYTLFYKAHRKVDPSHAAAATVTRPLFFEFPKDGNTYDIDTQFMVGSALLISPVLQLGQSSVTAYFPAAKWYDWYTHNVTTATGSASITLNAPIDHIPVHIRGGSIIPMQDPALTTTASKANNFSLLVAMDSTGQARGDLFLDDGVSIDITHFTFIEYSASKDQLTATVSGTGYASGVSPLARVTIIGIDGTPTKATLNGQSIPFSFDPNISTLSLKNFTVSMSSQFTIAWQ